MRKLTYYVAATIDGFIAGPKGEFDFFPVEPDISAAMNAERPETVPTRFRAAAGVADAPNRRFDTVLMGRGTYDPALEEGTTSPYAHLEQFVFSRTLAQLDPAVPIVSTDPVAFVRELKARDGLDIWLCGGGRLAGALRPEIDELVVKRYPVAIGTGTPMFGGPFTATGFAVADSRTFESGAVVVTYTRV
jgi:dihydrofolate reductase